MSRSKNKPITTIDDNEAVNSEDEYRQIGGEDDRSVSELGSDTEDLDIDPDDEADPIADDKYDPVNENEDLEDPSEKSEASSSENEEAEDSKETFENDNEDLITESSSTCHLKNLINDTIIVDEDDSTAYGKMEYKRIANENRITDSTMTYYEMVRIIGVRSQQFNFGAVPLVQNVNHLNPAKMAYVELMAKMTPFIIRRNLPNKFYEEWHVSELDIVHPINDSFFVPTNSHITPS